MPCGGSSRDPDFGYHPSMPDRFDVELDDGVIVVRYDGRPTDSMFEDYLERYTTLLMRKVPYAAVYSSMPGARMPHPAHVRTLAKWMRDHRKVLLQCSRGLAFALPSPVMRGVLRGLLSIQPLAADHIVVNDEAEAIAWARGRLATPT